MKTILLLSIALTFSAHADPRTKYDIKDFPFVARLVIVFKTRQTDPATFKNQKWLEAFNAAKQKGRDFFVSQCTGSLIRPYVVLTAGHCVKQFESEVDIAHAYPFAHLVAEFPGHLEDPVTVKKVFYIYMQSPQADWALLMLDRKIEDIKPIKIASPHEEIMPDTTLLSIGFDNELFPSGLRPRPLHVDKCSVYLPDENEFIRGAHKKLPGLTMTNCYVKVGNSGGPVIANIRGEFQLVGINIQAFTHPHLNNWELMLDKLGLAAPKPVTVMLPTPLLPEYLMHRE